MSRPNLTAHFTFRFSIKTKNVWEKVLNLTCRTISVCELLQICDQSVYLNHSNKDCNWLVVACFMRVKSKLTTLLFALEINFALKIECDAWGV